MSGPEIVPPAIVMVVASSPASVPWLPTPKPPSPNATAPPFIANEPPPVTNTPQQPDVTVPDVSVPVAPTSSTPCSDALIVAPSMVTLPAVAYTP